MEDSRFGFSELTALDKKTKLMWTRDANIPSGGRNWDAAVDFIKQCNMQNYAGCSDWRLPDMKELVTLVDYARSQGNKIYELFNRIGFKNVQSNMYWSSTSDASNTNYAWFVYMGNGYMDAFAKSHNFYIWPVRF